MNRQLIKLIIERVFPEGSKLLPGENKLYLDEKFLLIGNSKNPRWIIPQNPRYGFSVIKQWRPYGKFSNLKWKFLLTVYQIGKLQSLPGVTSIRISDVATKDWHHLGFEELSLLPVIYIGTPGPNRKAVVSLIDKKACQLIGIAKVPLANRAITQILKEATNLTHLSTERPGLAPGLLHINQEQGITVQTAKQGRLSKPKLTSAHISWFSNALIPDRQTSLQEQVIELNKRLATLDSIETSMQVNLTRLLEKLDDPTPLPSFWVHGDFTPWNLKLANNNQLTAIDWEEAHANGLPLQDLFHFLYIQSHLLQKNPNLLETTRKKPIVAHYLNSLGIDCQIYEKLAYFYLVESWLACQEREDWDFASFLAKEISQVLGAMK